jgi:PadR family transcriptional regulator, regulatory protein AphA
MTGYELKQAIDSSTGFFWHAHHSQIYTTLRLMEKGGLVSSVFVREDDALRRRVYTLTDEGRKELTDWLDTPMTEVPPLKEDFLVRMFFSGQRDPQKVLDELSIQRKLHLATQKSYQNLHDCMPYQDDPRNIGLENHQKFWHLTLEMGLLYEKMYLDWLDIAEKTIKPE